MSTSINTDTISRDRALPLPAQKSGLWRDLKEAIAGSEQDFTQGGIGRAIFLLSVPMVLEMMMESVFAVVDIFFVSRLGSDAVAAVGLTESMLTIVYAIGVGLAMATTAMVARRIGEKKRQEASVAALQAILVSLLISAPIAISGIFFSENLLVMMGAAPDVIAKGLDYTTLMIGANVVIMLLFVNNAVFRGAGAAAISMRALWIANGLNLILDPCLIMGLGFFPELGIKGAAIATIVGRCVGVFYQFAMLANTKSRINFRHGYLQLNFGVMKKLVQLSLGGIAQFIIATSSWIGLMRIMATFGSESLAGYTIAIRVVIFSIMPAWGMSNAAATLVGQNLGAAKADRAEKSVWKTAWVNVAFLSSIGIFFYLFDETLIRIFSQDPEVVKIGAQALRYFSYGYPFYGFGMVLVQAFNGAGDTATPTKINFICFWVTEIPLAYMLATQADLFFFSGLGLREPGVFTSVIISESLIGLFGVILFKRGKWKKKEV